MGIITSHKCVYLLLKRHVQSWERGEVATSSSKQETAALWEILYVLHLRTSRNNLLNQESKSLDEYKHEITSLPVVWCWCSVSRPWDLFVFDVLCSFVKLPTVDALHKILSPASSPTLIITFCALKSFFAPCM